MAEPGQYIHSCASPFLQGQEVQPPGRKPYSIISLEYTGCPGCRDDTTATVNAAPVHREFPGELNYIARDALSG